MLKVDDKIIAIYNSFFNDIVKLSKKIVLALNPVNVDYSSIFSYLTIKVGTKALASGFIDI